jgi:ATP/maltotriose-dependent transcriptional regulator MalT
MTESSSGPGEAVGRDAECRAVEDFLNEVPSGLAVLAIDGAPGIGKSTIWRDALVHARDRGWRVLACEPAEAEAGMSFAGLGDLLEPAIDGVLGELPSPQARALEAALLRVEIADSPRDERGVSVAFLTTLRLLGEQSPVLIAIDDAHWLDRPTARVLEFALRRLTGEPVGVLASVRSGGQARSRINFERSVDPGCRARIQLGPLSVAALHDLLRARLGMAPPRRMLLRVHELSGGNPFFAIELARALAERDEPLPPGEALPVPGTLSELVAGRLKRLGAPTREALLVAAALAHPSSVLIAQFDQSSDASEILGNAERHGLIGIDRGRIRFTHPLVASTLYARATVSARQRVHKRLAEIVEDSEQRARHLALAAEGPDERVAEALEQAADIAEARGAADAAAELCELARDATPGERSDAARRRNLAAAGHHFAAGESEQARILVEQVIAAGSSGLELARALHLLAKIRYYGDSFPEAARLLSDALEHAGDDAATRAPIELDLAYVTQTLGGFPAAAERGRAALAQARTLDQPGLLAEAMGLVAIHDFFSGRGVDREMLDRALELEDRTRRVVVGLRPSLNAGLVLAWIGESEAARARLEDLRAWLIERGEESQLPMLAGIGLVLAVAWQGDVPAAAAYAREALEAATQVNTDASRALALCAVACASSYIGETEDALRYTQESIELFRRIGWHVATVIPLTGLGQMYLSLDEPAETDRLLRPVVSMLENAGAVSEASASPLANEIEALIGIGELELAEALLDPLEQSALAASRAIALAQAARCRGLLLAAKGDHDGAVATLHYALEQHDRVRRPVDLARTLLALGQVQRRANRRRAARETLERALAIFEETGFALWDRRTRGELTRLGLRRQAGNELTPTEQQVAERAGSGMTNRQIAGALFISPKTVEANLARVYRKLGIASRAELGRRIAEQERAKAAKG